MTKRLDVTRETLRRWRSLGCPYILLGHLIFYEWEAVKDWGRENAKALLGEGSFRA